MIKNAIIVRFWSSTFKTNDVNLLQVYGNQYDTSFNTRNELEQAQIFLDRAIYRPGQTVYFKRIGTAF